jgi:hypothetical protein
MVTKAALDFAKQKAGGLLAGNGTENRNRQMGSQNNPTSGRADFEPVILNENASRSSMGSY